MKLQEIIAAPELEPSQTHWALQAIKDGKSHIWTNTENNPGPWLSKEDASKAMNDVLDLIDTEDYEWQGSIIRVVKVQA